LSGDDKATTPNARMDSKKELIEMLINSIYCDTIYMHDTNVGARLVGRLIRPQHLTHAWIQESHPPKCPETHRGTQPPTSTKPMQEPD